MGYYVRMTGGDFVVPETPEVLAAIHEMDTKFHHLKRGGCHVGGEKTESWFSWMPPLHTLESVNAVFTALGFEIGETPEGICLIDYDNKTGQEDLFLAVVAPFVKDGSWLEWRGEDDEMYRFTVRGGALTVAKPMATVTWSDESPYAYWHFSSYRDEEGTFRTVSVMIDINEDVEAQINAKAGAK